MNVCGMLAAAKLKYVDLLTNTLELEQTPLGSMERFSGVLILASSSTHHFYSLSYEHCRGVSVSTADSGLVHDSTI